MPDPGGPSVVALGGGHGLAATLEAVRRYAGSVTAVVSVADDGGSSGRLRRERSVPPPGDLRKCLVALAEEGSVWAAALEHRFRGGTLDGHALGNLVLAGLTETLSDFTLAVEEVARLLAAVGEVLPATVEPVVLKADVDGRPVEGQVAVMRSEGRVARVAIVPADVRAPARAVEAIGAADQVVLAPGSLFTSVVPVLCVGDLRRAIADSPARVVQVCNLRPQVPETEGLSGADHLRAVLEHGGRVDTFLYDADAALPVDGVEVEALGARPAGAATAVPVDGEGPDALPTAHDPERLAAALASLC